MKRWVLAFGLLLVLTAAAPPAPAQTRVSVAVGFGVPRPYVSGVVVVGRPYFYRPYFYYRPYVYRRPVVVVVPQPYRAHRLFVDRAVVVRAWGRGHHHHHHHFDFDDDDE